MFQPSAGDKIEIDGEVYTFAPHPAMPKMPYGQEGRQAIVYRLDSESGSKALKVFKARYRRPWLVRMIRSMKSYSQLPGMAGRAS